MLKADDLHQANPAARLTRSLLRMAIPENSGEMSRWLATAIQYLIATPAVSCQMSSESALGKGNSKSRSGRVLAAVGAYIIGNIS